MDRPKNLESNLNKVNGLYININEERSTYTAHYNELRNLLYSTIKEKNQILKKLLKGHKLEGSYGDNLKVATPDEFDLVINLAFPENDYIIVKADPQRPGNVTLDMTQVMERIRNQEHNRELYEQLQKIVNAKNMLLENKLQSWLQGLFTMTLNGLNNQLDVNGHISQLVYKRSGPAHTIYIKEPQVYSVDFVPSIRLSAKQIVLGPKQREYFGKTEYWNAIPKPLKGLQGDNISYRASYFDAEHDLLNDKGNLKNGIRFMKKFRDTKQNMGNLKSYYIKTLFLWQAIEREPGYWHKQLNEILIDMFNKLADCLKTDKRNGKLLFFWDPKLDMFADFTESQRKDMFNCAVGCGAYFLKMASGNMNDNNIENVLSSFCKAQERGSNGKLEDKTDSKRTEKRAQTNGTNTTSLAPSTSKGQKSQIKGKTNQPEAAVYPTEAEIKTNTGAKPKNPETVSEPKVKPTPSAPSKPAGQNDQTKTKTNQPAVAKTDTGAKPKKPETVSEPKVKPTPSAPSKPAGQKDQTKTKTNQPAVAKTDTGAKPKNSANVKEPKANPPSAKPAEKNCESKSKAKQQAAPVTKPVQAVTKTERETKSKTLPQPSESVSEQKNAQNSQTKAKTNQPAKDEKQSNESSCKLS
ncbi:cyclic GMP-AMP synthase-like receptor 1 [Drosophila tropicalis]|uniref:cyclic GMP-AMP synthase-like receptor 1 n=1 Tax=Drosophila tropicalis TaxID=46794 RepID=UPI0035ABF307